MEAAGKLFHRIADKYSTLDLNELEIKIFRGSKNSNELSITSVAIAISKSSDSNTSNVFLYSASKDATIVKWDFYTGRKLHKIVGGLKPTQKLKTKLGSRKLNSVKGHSDEILSLAVSADGMFLVSMSSPFISFIYLSFHFSFEF